MQEIYSVAAAEILATQPPICWRVCWCTVARQRVQTLADHEQLGETSGLAIYEIIKLMDGGLLIQAPVTAVACRSTPAGPTQQRQQPPAASHSQRQQPLTASHD